MAQNLPTALGSWVGSNEAKCRLFQKYFNMNTFLVNITLSYKR